LVFLFWIATRGKNMKRILLTTTSLVMAAGVANADITWSGTATVGVAREGKVAASTANLTDAQINAIDAAAGDVSSAVGSGANLTTDYTDPAFASAGAGTAAEIAAFRKANAAAIVVSAGEAALTTAEKAALVAEQASLEAWIALYAGTAGTTTTVALGWADGYAVGAVTLADIDNAANNILSEVDALVDARLVVVKELLRADGYNSVTAATAAGDFESYSEVNATVTGSVTGDNGITLTASMSVDAGKGYDFADDDGFDAAKTNGVSLDNVTIATSIGTFKIDENAIAHLVDGDDDAAADLLYTNTVGTMSISAAVDLAKDTDPAYVAADGLNNVTGVANDVAWSAKVSAPLAGGSAYLSMDEEGGNAFGASATLSGVVITFDSKLEAAEEEQNKDRSNTIGLSYAMGATTLGATWNSVEDGDQWGISAAYAADGLTFSASTDEDSDWSVSGSMALGGGASLVAGTNYTEDAYLGMSFAF
jgi:hypothetical protein